MKKILVVLLALGLIAPAMAAAQSVEERVSDLEEAMGMFQKEGKQIKEQMKRGFHFGASFRTHLGYYDVDQEFVGGPYMDGTIGLPTVDDDSGTALNLSAQSTFGGKAVASDDFHGVFQVGLRESTGTTEVNEPYIRLAYGVWDFGSGKLTAGKDYTPGTYLGYSKQAGDVGISGESVMLATGLPYLSRQPQMKLSFGDFDIAIIEPNQDAVDYAKSASYSEGWDTAFDRADTGEFGAPTDPGFQDQLQGAFVEESAAFGNASDFDKDFDLPRIEAAHVFRLNNDNLRIRPVLGYQTYDVEYYIDGEEEDSESIESYLAGLGVSADISDAYVKGTVSYLQNPGNYGDFQLGLRNRLDVMGNSSVLDIPSLSIINAQLTEDGFKDSDVIQGTLVGGYTLNDMVSFEGGVGYMNGEVDLPGAVVFSITEDPADFEVRTAEQTSMAYYLQAWITMTDNVSFIPEIGMLDQGDLEIDGLEDIDGGKMTYFDVSCRFDF